jgi:hypothetical protein
MRPRMHTGFSMSKSLRDTATAAAAAHTPGPASYDPFGTPAPPALFLPPPAHPAPALPIAIIAAPTH